MLLNLPLLLALALSTRPDIIAGYYLSVTAECTASSSDLSDVELIYTHYCNKDLYIQFNSSVGRFVGLNEYGGNMAETWNNSPLLQQLQSELDRYCKPNLKEDFDVLLDKTVLPTIRITSEQEAVAGRPAMLISTPTWSTRPNLERRSPVWWSMSAPWNPSSLTGIRLFLILKRARLLPVLQECCWGLSWQLLDSFTTRGNLQGNCRCQLKFWSLGFPIIAVESEWKIYL
ncbi:hypothetical protein MHYP_G00348770 [Metynnis hypsauchen]